jgi:hypothetical protein
MRRRLPDGIELDGDPARVDVDEVHRFLRDEAYWVPGRSRETIGRLAEGSLGGVRDPLEGAIPSGTATVRAKYRLSETLAASSLLGSSARIYYLRTVVRERERRIVDRGGSLCTSE